MSANVEEAKVDALVEGLMGTYRVGTKYYIFTPTFHYIGRVGSVFPDGSLLLEKTALIVIYAGESNNAVSLICQGKAKPHIYECPGCQIIIEKHAIISALEAPKIAL